MQGVTAAGTKSHPISVQKGHIVFNNDLRV